MRLRYLLPALLVATALIATPATAQSEQASPTVGVGVSGLGGTTLYVPIHLPSLRIEPHIGYSRTSISRDEDDDESTSTFEVGGGVFTTLNSYENADLYAGGRLGLQRNADTEGATTISTTDFFIGPAIGGEYFFGDHFSLGLEGALYFRSIGRTSETISESRINTDGRIFARIYF